MGLLATFLGKNEFIILDEPYNSLDFYSRKYLSKLIRKYNDACSTTFLISSHNLDEVITVSSRVIILKKGIIVTDSPTTNISKEAIEQQLDNS
ncbi:hypothetical protein NBT05_05745 [Aquimarina sp. ERC-38]|uniref:hypothetical protein n=1 Tax=Aquimarina sp. ERC-38 TaxID=2949996 RepID=UPI002247321B|nr:hypothetical protein [Aquimarina sp. ERC-38]UZO81968.1 hypothetical protein NBT05_05745 [Aquimarina sp. ERC-38]